MMMYLIVFKENEHVTQFNGWVDDVLSFETHKKGLRTVKNVLIKVNVIH